MNGESVTGSGVRVVSAVAGRVRLRASAPSAQRSLASLAEELGSWPNVTSVQLRARSASLIVRFDPEDAGDVADGLLSFGVDLRADAGLAVRPDPAAAINAAAASADRAVARRLDGIDLRVLLPLGLGMLAARRAMRGDERLADAPWYALAWYASGLFWRFHGAEAAGREVGESKGE